MLLNRWVLLKVAVQPFEGFDALYDHDDEDFQDHEIPVGFGPSAAYWLWVLRFIDIVHEAQNLYEVVVIIDHDSSSDIDNITYCQHIIGACQ